MSASLAELKTSQHAVPPASDQAVDMFTERGFVLANRIAKAFATSDAVPAAFRLTVEKKDRNGSQWIDNPAAIGNCLVAIETARAVGMSITSVMQHANVIEGRLSWSAQFIIAAINASGRFTPLRFQIRSLGRMKAKYREKLGWNKAKGGFDFADREVEVDNLECVAWAFIKENGRTTDERVESAPVSMKMAVEEGWYGKSGSKWQTEMKHLMLQYRAGAFFGRIHAPDIVMGMGHTSEELRDVTTVDVAPDGRVMSVTTETVETLRQPPAAAVAAGPVLVVQEAEQPQQGTPADPETGEISPASAPAAPPPPAEPEAGGAPAPAPAPAAAKPAKTYAQYADDITKAKDADAGVLVLDSARKVLPADQQKDLAAHWQRTWGDK